MIPDEFEQANRTFSPPPGLTEGQCVPIKVFAGCAEGGSCDGIPIVVAAWKPSEEEIDDILDGRPVFITFVGGLPPHTVTTRFERAIRPA